MRVSELELEFFALDGTRGTRGIDTIAEADGVEFLCPICFATKGSPAGTHRISLLRPHVPHPSYVEPGRWEFEGESFEDLSLSPSVQVGGGCPAHFFVRSGAIVIA